MIQTDEDALICDLAETYQIYDYRQLPAYKVAVFSYGLRDDSRIKVAMSGQNVSMQLLIQASILDRLSMLVWFKTKDGQNGINRPVSMVDQLTKVEEEQEQMTFVSGEEFENYRNEMLKKIGGGS